MAMTAAASASKGVSSSSSSSVTSQEISMILRIKEWRIGSETDEKLKRSEIVETVKNRRRVDIGQSDKLDEMIQSAHNSSTTAAAASHHGKSGGGGGGKQSVSLLLSPSSFIVRGGEKKIVIELCGENTSKTQPPQLFVKLYFNV